MLEGAETLIKCFGYNMKLFAHSFFNLRNELEVNGAAVAATYGEAVAATYGEDVAAKNGAALAEAYGSAVASPKDEGI